jgi:flagellar L-ring protein precursor FlgH
MKSYYQRILVFVILSLMLIFASTSLLAASLYSDSNSLYDGYKASKVGDIVTVIIREESAANQQANTDTEQSNSLEAGPGGGLLDFIKMLQMDQEDSSSASGNTSRSGNLTAQMTVQVEKVLSNGNLRIHGVKEITINGETQKIELSGIIRPEDIDGNNIIDSTKLANGRIKYDGQGPIGDKQRPGLLTRMFNWIF